ncbi:MAG TPA: metallophosphoesterase [Actinomycetaceae bacterium]|nr:metallophosphoesterase [Actinomycetaceae bacterium]
MTGIAGTGLGLGAGVFAWALIEAAWIHRIRSHEIRLTAKGNVEADGESASEGKEAPKHLTVLHLSDLHLLPSQIARQRFVRALARRVRPDLVVFTGDAMASPLAVPAVLGALGELLDIPGVFVFGSNDYFGPRPRNPLQYMWRSSTPRSSEYVRLPAADLAAALRERGWLDLRNTRGTLTAAGLELSFVGVDDPHIERDHYPADDGVRGDLHIGVAHAPYSRVLDAFHDEGCAVGFFGHTHGGQVRVPLYGALVTNCDLPTWRASGLQGWPGLRPDGRSVEPRPFLAPVPDSLPDDGGPPMWVNISAGLGTSPYAPIRFACPPEVSVLRFAHSTDF